MADVPLMFVKRLRILSVYLARRIFNNCNKGCCRTYYISVISHIGIPSVITALKERHGRAYDV